MIFPLPIVILSEVEGSALGGFAAGGSEGDEAPPAYLNYILFDQQYKVLDAGWTVVPTSANFAKQKVTIPAKYITEAGYYFTYLSYEGESNNYVYFDDYKVRHVKSNLIQGNEYYPFGLQTANSWTREAVTGNNYLANGGTELNQTSQLYDLQFRNYDPALGRMFQVDPVAAKYASLTPYNYSFNNPAGFSDPSGADPDPEFERMRNSQNYFNNGGGAYGYPGLTYDDWDPMTKLATGESQCTRCWDKDNMMGWFNGGGPSLNAGTLGTMQSRRAEAMKGRALRDAIVSAYGGSGGSTIFALRDGWISDYDFKSTKDLLLAAGISIARDYYRGNGSMPEGYVPPNHRPAVAQLAYGGGGGGDPMLGTSSSFGAGPGRIEVTAYEEHYWDYGDGSFGVGFNVTAYYRPSEEQAAKFPNYNMIAIVGGGIGIDEKPLTFDGKYGNPGHIYYYNAYHPGAATEFVHDRFSREFNMIVTPDIQSTLSVQIYFVGFGSDSIVPLGVATFGLTYENGKSTLWPRSLETW